MDTVIFLIQCLGVVSFAISGTIIAISKKSDFVGALIISFLTVFGGGFIRDLTLGITPPHIFFDREYHLLALIVLVVSTVCFHLAFSKKASSFMFRHKNDFWLNFFDAIGLAIFCIFGIKTAINYGYGENYGLLIFVGGITGAGGGILRDLFANEIPMVFRKHVYLLPTILGACIYVFTYKIIPEPISLIVSILFIIVLRVFAIIFRWNLPVPGRNNENNEKE